MLRVITCLFISLVSIFSTATLSAQGLSHLTEWQEGRSMRAGSNAWIENDPYDGQNNMDRPDRIEPGETYVMADLQGPVSSPTSG